MISRPARAAGLLGLLALLAAPGCSNNTGSVSGKVLFNGKPLPGGSINFASVDGAGKVLGTQVSAIEDDGSYTVRKVPVGPVKITVQGRSGGPPIDPAKVKMPKDIPIRKEVGVYVPPRYASTDTTDLTFTVQSGHQEHDITLSK